MQEASGNNKDYFSFSTVLKIWRAYFTYIPTMRKLTEGFLFSKLTKSFVWEMTLKFSTRKSLFPLPEVTIWKK